MTDTNTAEREAIIRAAVAAMPHTNPLVADDLLGGFTMHTEADDIVAIFQAGRASLAASAGSEPMFWVRLFRDGLYEGPVHHKSVGGKMLRDEKPGEWTPLYTNPSPPEGMAGWISVDERLPEVGVTVLVYEPFRHGEDWPGTVRISFDHICPDYEGWHDHCASYEHFMAVGGVNACGPDVTCTGPSEKAPYTHWMPLPAPPLPASEAKEL